MCHSIKISLLLLVLFGCHSRNNGQSATGPGSVFENMEHGSKASYAAGDVRFQSGLWRLTDALTGRTVGDVKNDKAALRLKPGGMAETRFGIRLQSGNASVQYAGFSNDAGGVLHVFFSEDAGGHWHIAGKSATAGSELQRLSFRIPVGKTIRLRFVNAGTGRLNVDDLALSGKVVADNEASQANIEVIVPSNIPGRDDNMALGNPSRAGKDKNNFLVAKPQYALSYNNDKGSANWVSWHLSREWMGSADRCNCFMPDTSLPRGFFRAKPSDYLASGFDRGHLCPSADRSASDTDNAATFLMTNMAPQSPNLNRKTWERLEDYCRKLTEHGMELYIIAGSYGEGGAGDKGDAATIGKGKITVPARYWKIIVVLPEGDNDLQRINKETRVIAVDMPNVPEVSNRNWNFYQTSVATIEEATGYRFFSNLPADVQAALKQKVDGKR